MIGTLSKALLFIAASLFIFGSDQAQAQFGAPQWGQPMQNAAPQFPRQRQNALQGMYQQQQEQQQQIQQQMYQREEQLQQRLYQSPNRRCALVGGVIACPGN